MRYLVLDPTLHGTGIRDQYEGGYVKPEDLGLSSEIIQRLKEWLLKYENEHYNGYENEHLVSQLDAEGKELAKIIKKELTTIKMEYFSDALMKKEIID